MTPEEARLALAAALAAVGAQRLLELLWARRTARGLARLGAALVRDDGYGAIVTLHAAWFAALAAEGLWLGAPALGWWTWAAGAAFLAGTALRLWSMQALGPRWSTRVWVLPAAPLVARGPYRFARHPIYAGVTLELAAFPLAFGLWWTAALAAVPHALVLLRRIRKEERALGIRPRALAGPQPARAAPPARRAP